MTNVVVIIPARMASSRLPDKILLDINGKTLIQHVYENVAKYTDFPVYVAAGEQEILDVVEGFGGKAVLTDPDLPSGSDRVAEALEKIDPEGKYDVVVNFQGDSINVDPDIINKLVDLLIRSKADITTPCMVMDANNYNDPGSVKLIAPFDDNIKEGRCLYFTRVAAPYDRDKNDNIVAKLYHHLGIYAYKVEALKQFVKADEGVLEQREKLEQLRALENGMSIFSTVVDKLKLVDEAPADIDTQEELEECRKYIGV